MFGLIKTRMTLFYTLIVFILLATFGSFLYLGLKTLLLRNLDRQLLVFADAIEDSYDPVNNEFTFLEAGTENYQTAKNGWIRIINKNGSVLFQSDPFSKAAIAFPLGSVTGLKAEQHLYREFERGNGEHFRSIILPVLNSRAAYLGGWVEVGESLKNLENTLTFFRKLLLISLPVSLLIVGAISFLMVRHLFRPVSLMAAQTERITYENLNERLPVINQKDELGRLALRFNSLLERLENSFRQQRQLLSDVSHELKTPLTILRTRWESEISNVNLPEITRRRLSADVEELARLSKMVTDLTLLSRSLETLPDIRKESVDLDPLLTRLVDDLQPLANEKQLQLGWKGNGAQFINGESRLLRRLFLNLLDNAIKYTPPGGKIFIRSAAKADNAVVEIIDNGIGIRQSELRRVFQRFYRAENVKKSNIRGIGLGLPLAKWIAHAHGGFLEVESEPEIGTHITVTLPLANNAKSGIFQN